MDKVNHILTFLETFKSLSRSNIKILNQFRSTLDSLIATLQFISLENKVELLKRELKFSDIKYKSGKISANRNLIKKLKESIGTNQKKLDSIKEDYFNIRNQRNQIIETINNYQDKLNELNQQRKQKFKEINKIIRNTETLTLDNKKDLEIGQDLSNNEKIKQLRREAKIISDQIKELESKITNKCEI
jgi:chromosome segregation ATPase